jgi:hypothetical protein
VVLSFPEVATANTVSLEKEEVGIVRSRQLYRLRRQQKGWSRFSFRSYSRALRTLVSAVLERQGSQIRADALSGVRLRSSTISFPFQNLSPFGEAVLQCITRRNLLSSSSPKTHAEFPVPNETVQLLEPVIT